ncbi:MAG: DNA repair protein RadC [Armatimonadota bacterium]|nr:DNA repair protein RadC [Armatimonadota bacterium]MDR7454681.1 DNA repair protein RadC [Armatimonadota bacterium]MDR7456316.1 DNA repair protein RadC [Armatimonadota bacterium]MDR7496313.1 DNA repair protein RadC [Armatimonadota bacterium]MDR7512463.1 DNA repair protein RadC [Armatimonadota bacterium]
MSVKGLPLEDRPRERLLHHGAAALSSAELLAVLLRTGTRHAGAAELAGRLLAAFGSLEALSRAHPGELARHPGVGPAQAGAVVAAFELGRRVHSAPPARRPLVRAPADVAALLGPRLRHLDREHFCAVLLNTRHEVVEVASVAVGGLDAAPIHPREVFKEAVRRSAAAVILVHNHPSGVPEPSGDDLRITVRLAEAGRVVGIAVLDHVIIGDGRFVSLRERGALAP